MRKKLLTAFVVLLLVCLTGLMLASCDKGEELPVASPVLWEKYLSDAADRLTECVSRDGGKLGVRLTATTSTSSGGAELLVGLNYDMNDVDASCIVIEVTTSDAANDADTQAEDGVLFSLVADNFSTWIDIAPGLMLPDARMRIENMNIFDVLGVVYNESTADMAREAFSTLLINLGKAFFDGVSMSADGNEYVFFIDDDFKESGGQYFKSVLTVFGENVANALLAAFGIADTDELFELIPDMSGELVLTFDEDGARFSSERVMIDGGIAGITAAISAQDDFYADLSAEVAEREEALGYVTTKIGNSHMEGTLWLMTDGDRRVGYDYTLDADLDLLALILSGYDLSALEEDNYFHLRVSHTCDASCGTFCASRMAASDGAVVDFAFSPSDFGTYHTYVTLAVQSLISAERGEALDEDLGELVIGTLAVPEYTLFVYPVDKFDRESLPCRMLMALYADNIFSTEDVKVNITEDNGAIGFFGGLFVGDGEIEIDSLVFDIDVNDFGMAQPHDVYSETVLIANASSGRVKNYGAYVSYLALDWEWEAEVAESGESGAKTLTQIYDSEHGLLHGMSGGKHVPTSYEEMVGMAGDYYIKATCTDIYKTAEHNFYARVLDVKGLVDSSDGVQEVVFTVEYPTPFAALATALDGESQNTFVTTVTAHVRLTERKTEKVRFEAREAPGSTFGIISDDEPGSSGIYNGQSQERPSYLYAKATVEYVTGDVKEKELIGETDAVGVRDMVIFDDLYYTKKVGQITVEWRFLEAVYVATYHIAEPKDVEFTVRESSMPAHSVGETVYMSTITQHIDAVAVFDGDGGEKRVKTYLTAENLFINNTPLTQSTRNWTSESPWLGGTTVTFLIANDNYRCEARVFGFNSDTFTQRVDAYRGEPSQYGFTQTSASPHFWFTDTRYTFTGSISNTVLGLNDQPSRALTLSVGRYDAQSTSYPKAVDILAPESAVTLDSFTCSGFTYATGSLDDSLVTQDLPAVLISPRSVIFRLTFNQTGNYRVRLSLSGEGGFHYDWYITVS